MLEREKICSPCTVSPVEGSLMEVLSFGGTAANSRRQHWARWTDGLSLVGSRLRGVWLFEQAFGFPIRLSLPFFSSYVGSVSYNLLWVGGFSSSALLGGLLSDASAFFSVPAASSWQHAIL